MFFAYTDEHVAVIVKALGCEPDETWSPTCARDVARVVAEASNAGVEWAGRVAVWDISDECGANFLVTLDLERLARLRLAGMATDLKYVQHTDESAPDAVRRVLNHIRRQAGRMLTGLTDLEFASEI